MKKNDYYEYSLTTEIFHGTGSLNELAQIMLKFNIEKPLVITDKGIVGAGLLTPLLENIPADYYPVIFDAVPPDSDRLLVNEIAGLYRSGDCNGIIALGGGSVLDTAKGVNLVVSLNTDDLLDYAGAGTIPHELKPLIAVPTTSGTGSEVTQVAVIADHEIKRKMLFTSGFLQPQAALLDSCFTMTLPPHITAACAMDALCHACEAVYGLARNPFSEAAAFEAITLIVRHLPVLLKDPVHEEGRMALAQAATLAGTAFGNSMVGMAHSIGHSLGSVCGVPHAAAMAVLLPWAMEYNLDKADEYIAGLLEPLTGYFATAGTAVRARALGAITAVREFNNEMRELTDDRHATRLSEILNREGQCLVDKSQFNEVAETTLGDGSIIYNNTELDFDEIVEVLEQAW